MFSKTFRSVLVAVGICLAIVYGVRSAIWPDPQPIDLVLTLGFASAFALLCLVDSQIIKKPVVNIFLVMTFFAWPVLMPCYLVWSRGLKGLGLAVLFALLYLLLLAASYNITGCALFGSE